MPTKARIPIPADLSPAGRRCIAVQVPDDPEWRAMFFGALYQLTTWNAYDRDAGHTAKDVASLWKSLIDDAHSQECAEVLQFRQQTCILQKSTDGGVTWTDILNIEECILHALQQGELAGGQGAGAGPAPIGGCSIYHVHMNVGDQFVVPSTVNAGDQITISNVRGAWCDGWLGNFWFCPDGTSFILDVCVGPATPAKVGDPEQGLPHMNLLALVAGVYYNGYENTFTLPFGISNEQLLFLANDDPAKLPGAAGSVDFDVEICRNQLTYHLIDLRTDGAIITQTGANTWHVSQSRSGCDGTCPGSYCSSVELRDNNNICHSARWIMSNQTGWTAYGCAGHSGGIANCNGSYIALFNSANLVGDSGWQDYFNANYQNTDVGIIDFRSGSAFEYDIQATLINP